VADESQLLDGYQPRQCKALSDRNSLKIRLPFCGCTIAWHRVPRNGTACLPDYGVLDAAYNSRGYLGVRMGDGRVVDQVPDFEGEGATQGDKQVQGRGQLAQLNALDGGLFHVGDVREFLLGIAAGLA